MSGDVWEYLILGALIWLLGRRLRRAAAGQPRTGWPFQVPPRHFPP